MLPSPSRILLLLSLAAIPLASAAADDAMEQFHFATGLLVRNEPGLAAEEFQKLVGDHPDFAELDTALYRWGESLAKAGRPEEAKAVFERLLREKADSASVPETHYQLALLAAAAAPRDAAAHYAAVFRDAPDSPLAAPARIGWADALFQAGDWAEAAKAAAELLDATPEGPHAAHLRLVRAEALSKNGDTEGAVAAFQDFAARFPDDPQAAACRLQAAEGLRALGRHEEAVEAYLPLADAPAPVGADAWIGRAFSLHALKRPAEAAEAFLAAAKRMGDGDARAAGCLVNAGLAFTDAGELAKAVDAFEAATRAGGADDATRADAGRRLAAARSRAAADPFFARWEAKDFAAAADGAAAFLRDFPGDSRTPQVRQILAYSLLRLGRNAEAADAFRAILAALPDGEKPSDELLYALGCSELETSRAPGTGAEAAAAALAAARETFSRLADLHPGSARAPEALARAALAADALGHPDDARAAYRRIVEIAPESDFAAYALLELSRRSLAEGQHEDALASANRMAAAFPADRRIPFARLYAGDALMGLGRPGEALESYRAAASGDIPDDLAGIAADAVLGAAAALRALGRHAEAAETAASAAQDADPARAEEASWWAARSLEEAGDTEGAARRLADFAQRFPGSAHAAEAAFRRASCAFRMEKWDEADALYKAFLDARPDDPLAPQARYDWAWTALERGDFQTGESRLRDLVVRKPGGELEADALFRLGEIAFDAGRHADAARDYGAALAVPDIPFADKLLYKLGWAKTHLGDREGAIDAFRRISEEHPASELAGEALYLRGGLLAALGRHAEAAAVLEGVRDTPFDEKAAFLRAESLRAAGRHAEAIAAYSDVLGKWPGGERAAAASLGKGHSLRAEGASADALDAYAAAVAAANESPEAAQAILAQGDVHFEQGRWQEAAKAYLKVDILYGYEEFKPHALLMLARSWKNAGDAEKSAQYLARLRERYPDSPEAKEEP